LPGLLARAHLARKGDTQDEQSRCSGCRYPTFDHCIMSSTDDQRASYDR
jgi:hypothetical protein